MTNESKETVCVHCQHHFKASHSFLWEQPCNAFYSVTGTLEKLGVELTAPHLHKFESSQLYANEERLSKAVGTLLN